MRSSVRPVGAALMAAGPDEVRWPGPTQSIELGAPTMPRVVPVAAAVQIIISPRAPSQFGAMASRPPRSRSGHHRRSIDLVASQHSPGDASGLVGHGDGDDPSGPTLKQRADPEPRGHVTGASPSHHRGGPDHEQFAEIAIAHL